MWIEALNIDIVPDRFIRLCQGQQFPGNRSTQINLSECYEIRAIVIYPKDESHLTVATKTLLWMDRRKQLWFLHCNFP